MFCDKTCFLVEKVITISETSGSANSDVVFIFTLVKIFKVTNIGSLPPSHSNFPFGCYGNGECLYPYSLMKFVFFFMLLGEDHYLLRK